MRTKTRTGNCEYCGKPTDTAPGRPGRFHDDCVLQILRNRSARKSATKDDVKTMTKPLPRPPAPKIVRQTAPAVVPPELPASEPESDTQLHPSIPVTETKMDIDPNLAALWLSFNTHNRPLKDTNLEKISADLRNGRWKYTAEPIKFSKTGVLLDGQHRLHAIVRTGISALCLVVPGLDDEAQNVMDSGAARGAADALALAGEKNAPTLAAAVRIAIQMERGSLSTKVIITNSEIYGWLNTHTEMRDAVAATCHLKRMHLARSAVAYCMWHLSHLDEEAALEFFKDLSEHRTDGAGDPRSALLARLTSVKQQGVTLSQAAQISLIFRTWNFVRAGKPLGKIAVHYNGNAVDIPTPR